VWNVKSCIKLNTGKRGGGSVLCRREAMLNIFTPVRWRRRSPLPCASSSALPSGRLPLTESLTRNTPARPEAHCTHRGRSAFCQATPRLGFNNSCWHCRKRMRSACCFASFTVEGRKTRKTVHNCWAHAREQVFSLMGAIPTLLSAPLFPSSTHIL